MWDMIFIVPQKMKFSEDDVYDEATNDDFQEGENTVVCSGEIMEQASLGFLECNCQKKGVITSLLFYFGIDRQLTQVTHPRRLYTTLSRFQRLLHSLVLPLVRLR
jgi:hypothetical protein